MSCQQCVGLESQFGDRVAQRELRRFLKRGGKKQTRILVAQLQKTGIEGRSLLDIGGGIGAIQHACAEAGASSITNVDASSAYLATARGEAVARGYATKSSYLHGNFAEIASQVPPADFVTMDRVVCCYPNLEELLRPAAERAKLALALVFPRDNILMRCGVRLANMVLRLGRSDFRAFVHPHDAIEAHAAAAGLALSHSSTVGLWRVAVFTRKSTRTNQ